jgi:hypothetical protein
MHGPVAAAADATPSVAPVVAVWKMQQLTFEYRGSSTFYSCRSLHDKLKVILIGVGAREAMDLRSYTCDEASGIARFQIRFESPVVATPENVIAITTHDSTAELVARVNGKHLENAVDVQRFAAEWRTVSFARDREMKLAPGDCELVEQVRQQILPQLSIQIVRDNVRCSAALGNISPPRLTVSALMATNEDE